MCCVGYLEVVEVVSSIQVYAFGFLVDGHDSQADIQRAVEFPSLNLKNTATKFVFTRFFIYHSKHLQRAVKSTLESTE